MLVRDGIGCAAVLIFRLLVCVMACLKWVNRGFKFGAEVFVMNLVLGDSRASSRYRGGSLDDDVGF